MLLELQEHLQIARNEPISEICRPMDRLSIADYLEITHPALGLAFRALVAKKYWPRKGTTRGLPKLADAELSPTARNGHMALQGGY